jgi:prepilin-type N-terminal cleavage/methylation domain-containing protein
MKRKHFGTLGFTLVEILIVMAMVASLATWYVYQSTGDKGKAYTLRAQGELITMSNAIKLYVQENNAYPADVNRGLPPGIEKFIGSGELNTSWPTGPWGSPSVYDYENWDGGATVQVSIRFCTAGDDATCRANAKKWLKGAVSTTVLNNWDSYSSVYFCIKGDCRSHSDKPNTWPGYKIDSNTIFK